jgi:hypothetical protein
MGILLSRVLLVEDSESFWKFDRLTSGSTRDLPIREVSDGPHAVRGVTKLRPNRVSSGVKHSLVLLALLVALTGCGASSNNSAAPTAPPSGNSGGAATYDMLAWMTMQPAMATTQHMAGTANPLYTSVTGSRFYWTKTAGGYPWDIQLYDKNYIYLWVTELDWQNPNSFKEFNSPKMGKFNLPFAPRFAKGGYPGSTVKSNDSTYEIHSDCHTFVTKNLGHVINEVWGPYKETLGGQLPSNLKTLIVNYKYSCDVNYSNCRDKEEFHLAQPYGLVKWQHQKLGANGTYDPPDNVTVFNRVVTGQVTPVTTCF